VIENDDKPSNVLFPPDYQANPTGHFLQSRCQNTRCCCLPTCKQLKVAPQQSISHVFVNGEKETTLNHASGASQFCWLVYNLLSILYSYTGISSINPIVRLVMFTSLANDLGLPIVVFPERIKRILDRKPSCNHQATTFLNTARVLSGVK
jgi:hypothetical protein